ncbi:hypothetical protein CLAFUW4_04668 [Fulvia fulva]|uniref:Uncharacterized protein n=1 Tax=Passalora fulva TaxID=5499 RepID=A0A9Q8LFX9_PASFU|nr:uncharacterized protein CLAFUR5_04629 [Fulvia fulva]KAK4626840.1 hypothetical protein CLAFUR4_04654 [Fulvia fulva]KAK4627965.1 hypothetical protein CLAFUR0_04658 [Fulvia fulva]UJO16479.1 hypothetical protein CLAFUR5_04629 [Fulvia fulva]WPV13364.1 hypothetical protein CLAFUW4_04668 [Fulvia fulva]WPV28635.1 hypothetical protein CLAFUW7_04662 [Fulvia fulva]
MQHPALILVSRSDDAAYRDLRINIKVIVGLLLDLYVRRHPVPRGEKCSDIPNFDLLDPSRLPSTEQLRTRLHSSITTGLQSCGVKHVKRYIWLRSIESNSPVTG